MQQRIRSWLKKYGRTFYDPDFGYSDCDMIDSCMFDLSLRDDDMRKLVGTLVDEFIRES